MSRWLMNVYETFVKNKKKCSSFFVYCIVFYDYSVYCIVFYDYMVSNTS